MTKNNGQDSIATKKTTGPVIQLHQVEKPPQPRKLDGNKEVNINRADIQVGPTGSAKAGTRIHPGIKTQHERDNDLNGQIVEYVVDGRRIMVQRDPRKDQGPLESPSSDREDTDFMVPSLTDGFLKSNKL